MLTSYLILSQIFFLRYLLLARNQNILVIPHMVPRVTANSLQMNQILKGSNSTHLTMQRKLDLGNIICSMCQQTSCALHCFTHYVACYCSVFLTYFSCIVASLVIIFQMRHANFSIFFLPVR